MREEVSEGMTRCGFVVIYVDDTELDGVASRGGQKIDHHGVRGQKGGGWDVVSDKGLVHSPFVSVDANFRSDVARVGRGKNKPFVVKREAWLRGSVWVSVRTESGHCTKPGFLDEDDVELIIVFL